MTDVNKTPIHIELGERTHVHNPNSTAWRVLLRTTSGTVVEFDVIVGGSFVLTKGPDIAEVLIEVQSAVVPHSADSETKPDE